MIFEQIKVGGDRNFAYLIADEASGEAAVVDPAFHPKRLLDRAKELGLTIKYLFNTHGHHDHTNGNSRVLEHTDAVHVANGLASSITQAGDGDVFHLGELAITVLHTPGHTPDSICLLVQGHLMTGDTLFVGKVGGTGFGEDARQEYHSLHEKILTLPPETEVYPGHDYGTAPTSTLGNEIATNPFLLRDSFESFLELKMNWASYKREHGIS